MTDENIAKLRKFASDFPLVSFRKYDLIDYGRNDHLQDYFYFIKEGFVRVFLEKETGEIFGLEIDTKDDIVPYIFNKISMDSGKIQALHMDCLSDVNAYKIPKEELRIFFEKNNETYMSCLRISLKYIAIFLENIPRLIYGSTREKLSTFLLMLSEEYGQKVEGNISILVRLRHKDIGSFIGATREATSIQMGYLKKRKIINYSKGNIEIINRNALEKFVNT